MKESFTNRPNVLYGQRKSHLRTKQVLYRQRKCFLRMKKESFTDFSNKKQFRWFFFGEFTTWQALMTFKNLLATARVQYLWTFLLKLAMCATYIKWLWLQSLQKCTGCKHHGFWPALLYILKKRTGSMR